MQLFNLLHRSMMSGGVDNMEKYKIFDGTGTCLPKNRPGDL